MNIISSAADLIRLRTIALIAAITATTADAEVIYEDKGLYKKETWNIGKRYDDLDDPSDAPGVITRGRDPSSPSGPAVDFEGSVNPVPNAGSGQAERR